MINFNKKWKNFVNEDKFDTSLFRFQDGLHPRFWENNALNPEALDNLRKIADDLLKSLDIGAEPEDVIITGSIAGFNWHKLSDVDLHIILDFRKIDDNFDLVKDFLDAKRISWNKAHKIMIFDHEVEVYFQDVNEKHLAPGTYSVTDGEWLMQPTKDEAELDLTTAENKAKSLAKEIDHLFDMFKSEKYEESYDFSQKLKEKVKKLRSSGLEREGIYSPENLAFKMLRNSDYLEKLSSIKIDSYDKDLSLDEKDEFHENILKNWHNTVDEMLEIEKIAQDEDPKPNKEGEFEETSTEDLLNPKIPAPWDRNP